MYNDIIVGSIRPMNRALRFSVFYCYYVMSHWAHISKAWLIGTMTVLPLPQSQICNPGRSGQNWRVQNHNKTQEIIIILLLCASPLIQRVASYERKSPATWPLAQKHIEASNKEDIQAPHPCAFLRASEMKTLPCLDVFMLVASQHMEILVTVCSQRDVAMNRQFPGCNDGMSWADIVLCNVQDDNALSGMS